MANVKQGMLVPSPQWWKHLRAATIRGNRGWKRIFWKKQRKAEKRDIENRLKVDLECHGRQIS
jgi:hypothetical protein